MDDTENILLLAAGLGGYGIVYGFLRFLLKRMVENLPTSKVRSAAMGVCELQGTVRPWRDPLKAYYSGLDCVLYQYLVERRRTDSKGRTRWETIHEGGRRAPFYLEDETGRILVDPQGLRLELDVGFEAHGDNIPAPGMALSEDWRKQSFNPWPSLMEGTAYRVREWLLCPGDPAFILGGIGKNRDFVQDYKARLHQRIRELKAQPEKMKACDANQDGRIGEREWEQAVARLEQELLKEELSNADPAADDRILRRDPHYHLGLVAKSDEKRFLGRLRRQSLLWTAAGGLGLIVAGCLIVQTEPAVSAPWPAAAAALGAVLGWAAHHGAGSGLAEKIKEVVTWR